MTIGNIHTVPTTTYKPKGKHLPCKECLYGSIDSCPIGIRNLCGAHLGWIKDNIVHITSFNSMYKAKKETFDKVQFMEIVDNPAYFSTNEEIQERIYSFCQNCGFITQDQIDHDHLYLDEHCKCGSPVILEYYRYAQNNFGQIHQIKRDDEIMKSMQYEGL